MTAINQTSEWSALADHHAQVEPIHLRELGKSLANRIVDELDPAAPSPSHHDASTLAMIGRGRAAQSPAEGPTWAGSRRMLR